MKIFILLLIASTLLFCANKSVGQSNNKKEVKSESIVIKEVEKLAGNFKFTEGPAIDAKGNIYFTDIPNHLILILLFCNHLEHSFDQILETFPHNIEINFLCPRLEEYQYQKIL